MPSYLITGAARGIGFEFVRQLSAKPENIVFALVRNKATATNIDKLQAKNVHLLEADIVDYQKLKVVAAEVAKITGGSLDYLINNAAFLEETRRNNNLDGYPEGQEQLLEKDIHDSISVNVVGPIHTINTFLPLILKSPIKKVITLSSGMGDRELVLLAGVPNQAPYSISKAAVNLVVAKYAVEYKDRGVVFLALSPGLVDTSTKAPSAEEMAAYMAMVAAFQKFAPHFKGAIKPQESVELMLGIIHRWTIEETGAFVSHHGNQQWL